MRNIILTIAASLVIASGSALANGGQHGPSASAGGFAGVSAHSGVVTGASASGNGYAENYGAAGQTSTATLGVNASSSGIHLNGSAVTVGYTYNASLALGDAHAGGAAGAGGSAFFAAGGEFSTKGHLRGGARYRGEGGAYIVGGVHGSSESDSYAAYFGGVETGHANGAGVYASADATLDRTHRGRNVEIVADTSVEGWSGADSFRYKWGYAHGDSDGGAFGGALAGAWVDVHMRDRFRSGHSGGGSGCNNGEGNGGEGCSPGRGHGANNDED